MKLYITNTTTTYSDSNVYVDLYGRTENRKLQQIRVTGFDPYFFIDREVAKDIDPTAYEDIVDVEPFCGEESLMGTPLGKIVVSHPGAVPDLREQFESTWEADVLFTNRLRIDHGVKTGVELPTFSDSEQRVPVVLPNELEPVEMEVEERRLTFDIEVDDSNGFPTDGEERIISIVGHDNYRDEVVGYIDTNEQSIEEFSPELAESQEAPEPLDKLLYAPSEENMLRSFITWFNNVDPDLVVGWNSNDFDVPYLIQRLEKLGIDADILGRGSGGARAGPYDPEIDGRACYDMMDAWVSTKFTEPDSYSLDHAASVELNDQKLEYEPDSVMELYEEEPSTLLEYNGIDTVLTHQIGEEAVYDFKRRLRDIVGVDWDETIDNKDFVEMMVRRKLYKRGERGPTKTKPPSGANDYEGAYTLDPYTGVAENVVEIDLSSLYPMTIWMLNASPETKVPVSEAQDRDDVARAPNGVYYEREPEGLFKSLVSDALELKSTYKDDIKSAEMGSEEQKEAEEAYAVAKTIVNSIYGVTGWEWFFLYDKEVAESITVMSQQVTRRTEKFVNENTSGIVVYGDTDSCYVSWPEDRTQSGSLTASEEVVETLNREVYPELAEEYGMGDVECRWEMEIEKYCKRFFQAGRKKRYAYLKTWSDGMDYHEEIDEFGVTGFEAVRSDTAQVTEELQLEVLEKIVRGASPSEIGKAVHNYAEKIKPNPDDWEYIGIPSGIGKELDEYESETAQVRGAKNANRYLGLNLGGGDKPYRCYLDDSMVSDGEGRERIDVICYENDYEVGGEGLTVDVQRMETTVVKRPMEPILEAIDLDVDAATKGQTQQGLKAFM